MRFDRVTLDIAVVKESFFLRSFIFMRQSDYDHMNICLTFGFAAPRKCSMGKYDRHVMASKKCRP